MSVYKEGWYALHTLAAKSAQIYPDAADFGTLFRKGDRIWNLTQSAAHFYAVEGTRRSNNYSTGKSASIEVELMMEGDSRDATTYRFRLDVTVPSKPVKSRDGEYFDGYVYVEQIH